MKGQKNAVDIRADDVCQEDGGQQAVMMMLRVAAVASVYV